MSSQQEPSLAFLWKQRRRIRRLLFFTYRFNFRWFHNEVLNFIRRSAFSDTDVLVFATRFDDDGYVGGSNVFGESFGDLYSLDEWAKWDMRLQVRYVPATQHLFHNKFIVAEYEKPINGRRFAYLLGVGSANLTWGGWQRNFELWTWDAGKGLRACASFLKFLASMPSVGKGVVESWVDGINRCAQGSASLPWLFGDKEALRQRAFKALIGGIQGDARVLRILSPYFDEGSPQLMEEILSLLESSKGPLPRVEVWVDASQIFASASDYRSLMALQKKCNHKILVKSLRTKARAVHPVWEQVHAKAIELEGASGSVSRLLGSANFTAAAWIGRRNTETVFHETARESLPRLLDHSLEVGPVPDEALNRWACAETDMKDGHEAKQRYIYWAAFDETAQPHTLTVSYFSKDLPVSFEIVAAFDSRRTVPPRLQAIVELFQNVESWIRLKNQKGLLKLQLKSRLSLFPERMRVILKFADGTSIESGVEVSNPDFGLRDPTSGIPREPSYENVFGLGKTIVDPLPKRTTLEASDDDAPDEEEDVVEAPAAPDSLTDDPDFDRQPVGVQFAKSLAKAKVDPIQMKILRRRVEAFRSQAQDPAERMMLDVLHHATEEKAT